MTSMTLTIYGNRGEHFVKVPSCWIICGACEGCATDRGASVECDGGGFTSSEWEEQDDEFRENYLAGVYDRPCQSCKGLGRVQVIDYDAIEKNSKLAKLVAEHDRQVADDREIDREMAMERRMGA